MRKVFLFAGVCVTLMMLALGTYSASVEMGQEANLGPPPGIWEQANLGPPPGIWEQANLGPPPGIWEQA